MAGSLENHEGYMAKTKIDMDVMSPNQTGRSMRLIAQWYLTTLKSQCNAENEAEGNVHGCTKRLKGRNRVKNFGRKDNETQQWSLKSCGEDHTESFGGKKRRLFKNYNQSLKMLTMSDLRVDHFDVGDFDVL